MIVTNQTTADIYFGPLHLGAGIGTTLTVDDTSATSLYLTNDSVADALNNAYNSGKITVSGQAQPFPRPTGEPTVLHGDGDPEGLVYAPQGSVYMRRDGIQTNGGVIYVKTTGVTYNTGWLDLPTASGTTQAAPPGMLAAYAGSTAPAGWLLCDGSAVSRTTYALLFNAIGTLYGAGDGLTTFNLPDLRGRVPAGKGTNASVSSLGNNDGVAVGNRRPHHQHTVNDPGHSHVAQLYNTSSGNSVFAGGTGGSSNGQSTGSAGTGVSVGSSSDSLDAPAYLVVNYIIKT